MRMRALGVVAMAAALVVGLASPAAAQTKTFKDKSGDVNTSFQTPEGPSPWKADSSGLTDITKLKASYTAKALTFTATFAKKSKKNFNQIDISFAKAGTSEEAYSIFWTTDKTFKSWNGVHVAGDDWETVVAPVTVTRTTNTVTVTIDPGAIGTPKKVGFSFNASFAGGKKTMFNRVDTYPNVKMQADGLSWQVVYKKIKKG